MKMKYGYLWFTLAFFLFSIAGHWILGWFAFVDEAHAHGQEAQAGKFLIEIGRDTLENWQSEFLQLIWQVAGLAALWYLGSPQSKEGNDRLEEKIDFLLGQMEGGEMKRTELDRKYPRK